MKNSWVALQTVLDQGAELVLSDQQIWLMPIQEFGLDLTITSPLEVKMLFLPQEEGLLIRGRLTGQVVQPCTLCMEDATVNIEHNFDTFEPFPSEDDGDDTEIDEYFIRLAKYGSGFEINPGALAWEEFAGALPPYPLCRENCAGLCGQCGQNLNNGKCNCNKEQYDPRMEKLRGLKLNK
ncbi:DUF177 domain-containing protein [Desulfovibrio sp. OttesenSCG-928-F07]|nr:DUF177 domain-containing protein [Desulfovibrio sp. OttesenSCG-928-F07]